MAEKSSNVLFLLVSFSKCNLEMDSNCETVNYDLQSSTILRSSRRKITEFHSPGLIKIVSIVISFDI